MTYEEIQNVNKALYWLLAIEYQCNRVVSASKVEGSTNSPFQSTQLMEEHFFLVACNKARRWMEKLPASIFEKSEFETFSEQLSKSKKIRDKREHDDEYFGTNKKSNSEPTNQAQSGGLINLTVGTSVTVVRDGKIWLGGILDIQQCASTAVPIRTKLQTIQRAYWRDKQMKTEVLESYCSPDKLLD